MTPQEVLKLARQKNVEFIDLRFMDFPGLWQHTTCPVNELTLESFDNGFGFDGSSIRGWQAINESDMLLFPVAETAKIMDRNEGAVKALQHRAVRRLAQLLPEGLR